MRARTTRFGSATPCAAALLVSLTTPATAQVGGLVEAARVEVHLAPSGGGGAAVRVEYDVVPGPDGRVPVALLERAGAAGIEVFDGDGRPVTLRTTSGTLREGSVRAASSAAAVRLTFAYSVAGAIREDEGAYVARIPVLGVSLPPAGDGGDVFTVTVHTPEGWSVSDAFPSGLREAGIGRHQGTLSVVPSMVGVRGRTDGAWRPGADLAAELLTLGVLLTFVLVGWRRLRAVAA